MSDGRARLEQWVAAAAETEELWASTPSWRAHVVRRDVAGETVVWSDHALFAVAQPAAALTEFLDGTVTLADLADDLAAVTDAPIAVARSVVATVALELTSLAAIDGVVAPEPAADQVQAAPAPDPTEPAPEVARHLPVAAELAEPTGEPDTAEATRVEHSVDAKGNPVTTEYLADGRRRVTTQITFEDPQGQLALAAAISGDRSMAELVPVDSCLGSKLRNHDAVPLVSIVCADGVVRSVRCHDPAVAQALRCRAGDALAHGRRGPVVAFVVTALEGDGPCRVFDGAGRRRGRPRTTADVVSLVDQILGEFTAAAPNAAPSGRRTLGLALVSGPDRPSVLVPLPLLYDRHVASRLRRAGWTITWTAAELDDTGRVMAPSALGTPVVAGSDLVVVVPDGAVQPLVGRMHALVDPQSIPAEHRADVFDGLVALATSTRWESLDGTLPEVLDRVAGGSRG